jgi:hypothetical protein
LWNVPAIRCPDRRYLAFNGLLLNSVAERGSQSCYILALTSLPYEG